jgi:P-loop containing NTP hydrolase pore-1
MEGVHSRIEPCRCLKIVEQTVKSRQVCVAQAGADAVDACGRRSPHRPGLHTRDLVYERGHQFSMRSRWALRFIQSSQKTEPVRSDVHESFADNFNQGRERALWLSVNNDLLEATRRDLTDLGLESIPLARINDYSPKEEMTLPRGVLFSSYSSLIAAAKTGERRIDQIQQWLGSDGVVIFDEAHRAKNALASGFGDQPSPDRQ